MDELNNSNIMALLEEAAANNSNIVALLEEAAAKFAAKGLHLTAIVVGTYLYAILCWY